MKTAATAALLCLVLCAPARAQTGGWWDDLYAPAKSTLAGLLKDPLAMRGREAVFAIQIKGPEKFDESFLTPFSDARHLRFSAWAEDAPLWDKEVFEKPFARLYAVRGSPAAERLLKAREYARFRVSGHVAEVIRGEPWIAVDGADPIPLRLDEPALVHIVKARMLKGLKRYTAAAVEFRSAEHDGLPLAVRTMTMREEADCFHRTGKSDYALGRLRDALQLIPEEPATIDLRNSIRRQMGLEPAGK